ncbi:HNH endonuclease family protein [Streptomyces europaeiscabiei]|uniref:HNH endonuclease n=1 Tax=Streptomyces europaeiscabiei TaxID=146819 RepID=UPI0038F65F99
MIPLRRPDPTARLTRLCESGTLRIKTQGGTSEVADRQWRNAEAAKGEIRSLLQPVAPGIGRCMYCLDNLGTDIDHFEPRARAPLRTFDWLNHLLACSFCNSNAKRDEYPRDEKTGECLLIDPTVDDPADHIRLLPASGEYEEITAKGRHSIRVFDLNRSELLRGRVRMYRLCRSLLPVWHSKTLQSDVTGAEEAAAVLLEEPFGDVLRALQRRARTSVVAELTFGQELGAALVAWGRATR